MTQLRRRIVMSFLASSVLRLRSLCLAAILAASVTSKARAEEGMWTFDALPLEAMKAAYGSAPGQAWFAHLRLSAPRLSSGCSSSIVSSRGLMLTDQHCVAACEQELSSATNAFVEDGFLARDKAKERICPGLQADVLLSIADITAQVRSAVADATGARSVDARSAAVARIESESCRHSDQHCEIVSLFSGAQYKLYSYKRYDDVRLVFAPEYEIAQFGGDLDNFSFPRFCLDVALLRVYEDGKPALTPEHLTLDARAPKDAEPVFLAGNPGSTQRSFTQSQAVFRRDVLMPTMEVLLSEFRGRLIEAMSSDPNRRTSGQQSLYDLENNLKAYRAMAAALRDPKFFVGFAERDRSLQQRVAADSSLSSRTGDPWGEIDQAMTDYRAIYLPYTLLEERAGFGSVLYGYARKIVRSAEAAAASDAGAQPSPQTAPPDGLPGMTAPIGWLERLRLEFWLAKARELLTADDPRVIALLGDQSPETLSARLVSRTSLGDPAARIKLLRGGMGAVRASRDPLIQMVLASDDAAQAIRNRYAERVAGPVARAVIRLSEARFALQGAGIYPDATGSPRLSYGKIAGLTDGGRVIPPTTTLAGLFERANGSAPFQLPQTWLAAKDRLDRSLTLDAIATTDIAGGNSGSPVVAADGRQIGVMFDGNQFNIANIYAYSGDKGRTVFVSAEAIEAALRDVYSLNELVAEIGASSQPDGAIKH